VAVFLVRNFMQVFWVNYNKGEGQGEIETTPREGGVT
jgi:hypothetical protein